MKDDVDVEKFVEYFIAFYIGLIPLHFILAIAIVVTRDILLAILGLIDYTMLLWGPALLRRTARWFDEKESEKREKTPSITPIEGLP